MSILPEPDESDQPSVAERLRQQRMLHAHLGGATETWSFGYRPYLRIAVLHLMSCAAHGGVHHFAVTGEGAALTCSPNAVECINAANLFPNGMKIPEASVAPPYEAPKD